MFGLNKKELAIVVFAWLLFTLLTSSLYFYAYHLTPYGKTFTGNFRNFGDVNNYYSFSKQAALGRWLFKNINTPEAHKAIYFNLEFLIIGKTAYFTGMSIEAAYHLWRILGILAMFWIFFLFTKIYFPDLVSRVWLLAFYCLGSGFGWLMILYRWLAGQPEKIPLDFWTVLHPFNQMFFDVHVTWANVLNSLAIFWFFKGIETKNSNAFWLSGFIISLTGLIRPFGLIFFGGFVGLWAIINLFKKRLGVSELLNYGRCLSLPLIVLVYNVYIFKFHSVFKWWSIQNVVPSFGLITLSFHLGLPLLFVIGEFFNRDFKKTISDSEKLLYLWLGLVLFLVYSNQVFTFAYQFIVLGSVPIYLLGGGLLFKRNNSYTVRRPLSMIFSNPKIKAGVLAFLLIFTSLTTIWEIITINKLTLNSSAYLIKERLLASKWIEKNTSFESRFIASYFSANFLVRQTGRTVFAGYHYNTVEFVNKQQSLKKFFSFRDPDYNQQLLQKWQIDYVFVGKQERAYNKFMTYPMESYLEEIYQNRQFKIYKVKL